MRHLGVLTLYYTETGNFQAGNFSPDSFTLNVKDHRSSERVQAQTVETSNDHAQTYIAAWFERNNEVELADREKYEVKIYAITKDFYPETNVVKKVVFDVIFDEKVKPVDH